MALNWHGLGGINYTRAQANALLYQVGTFLVTRTKQLVPVKTGALQRSIYMRLDQANCIVTVYFPPFYAIYVEFGTRFMRAVGFVRQALLEASNRWHFNRITISLFPASQKSQPLRAYTAGYHLPTRQRLTIKQRLHVARHLTPLAERYARAFKAKGIKYEVKGP